MNIIIACGGSGGHIFPGITLASELIKRASHLRLLIVCSKRPLDIRILERSNLEFIAMPYNPFIFTLNPLKLFIFFVRLLKGLISSFKLLSDYRPGCVVGFGGSLSGPIIFAAWLLGIPTIIHEQNLIAGLANRIESLFADRVAVSFDDTKRFFDRRKAVTVGNPVRGFFQNLDKGLAKEYLGFDKDKFTIFVCGGSQGAGSLNRIAPEAFSIMNDREKAQLQVIHITGEADYESVKRRYAKEGITSKVFSFLDEMDKAYSASDLVIARAGATTIAELTYFGAPSILIPYPERRVHQIENAYFLSNNKASIVMEEGALNAEGLKEAIAGLLGNCDRLKEMSSNSKRLGRPDAGCILADEVLALAC